MTRRVRFTPFAAAGVFAASLCLAPGAEAVDVPFVAQPPQGGAGSFPITSADLDRDGDLDVVQIEGSPNRIAWWENLDGAGGSWSHQTISTALQQPRAVTVGDVDRDGDNDVVVASLNDSRLTWFENDGTGGGWTFRTIVSTLTSPLVVVVADIDRDGDGDVVYGTSTIPRVGWFENTSAGSTWIDHLIGTGSNTPSLAVTDLDSDGDLDVAGGSRWYKNPLGNGSVWTRGTVVLDLFTVAASDLDRDGDIDLVTSTTSGPSWQENVDGSGESWTPHALGPAVGSSGISLSPLDLDGDGDLDVVYSPLFQNSGPLVWVENTGGSGATWMTHTISPVLNANFMTVGDVDGDGDPDVMASGGHGFFAWLRNETIHGNACFVPDRVISTAAGAPQSVVHADVDGDGDLDAVSAAIFSGTVAWHENVGGSAATWTTRTITTAFDLAGKVTVGDVDRDGDVDVAALSIDATNAALAWFDNTAGNGSAWTTHTVSTVFGQGTHVELIDLSGDGDLDLLGSGANTSPTPWFENAAGNGSTWTPGTLPTARQTGVATGDLDGDGDPDVASVGFSGDGLGWSENTAGNGSAWTNHTIATPLGLTFAMEAVDIDGDGDLDVLHPGINSPVYNTVWYENVGGSATAWTPHTIAGADGVVIATADDLDRDGDQDVIVPESRNGVRWFENTAGNGSTWSGHPISDASGVAGGLSVADLDGDGDPDVLSATVITNTVAWHENQAGQAAIVVVSQAPPTAINSEVVSMLRATVTHLGRPGDGSLELASLGLRFEESPGDPLTTAEANALVESLRVYRDANGNGIFEPATDVLVTSIGTLALTGGVQAVPFADGDPNVQVVQGTPLGYFVVVELTATASGQVPNQLMVTLLEVGPSASVLEDRTFDIPLRLACPADVSSTIKQAVPVELIGFSVE